MTDTPQDTWTPSHKQELEVAREAIDAVDSELLCLLQRRASLSQTIGRIKQETARKAGLHESIVFDPVREKALIERLVACNDNVLPKVHIENIWREIMSASRSLQKTQHVACLGPEGTFSYFAVQEYLGRSVLIEPCSEFGEVFRKVHEGCALGVVPLENSLHGTVGACLDLFANYAVQIRAEFFSRIRQFLLSRESRLADIHTVYSHPQALGQCAQWLRLHVPQARQVATASTAEAARLACEIAGSAAIGHQRLSESSGLAVLASSLEDTLHNWTRFVVIQSAAAMLPMEETTRQGSSEGSSACVSENQAMKTSLLFVLPDKAGSLASVLVALAEHGINMCKLESRPLREGVSWQYRFFADLDCNLCAPQHTALVERLRGLCTTFRVLGCYPYVVCPETALVSDCEV